MARIERSVAGLRFATQCERPSCIPVGRPRGAKAQGVRYERAVADVLQGTFNSNRIVHGQWFEFHDANGKGYAQVDLLLYLQALDLYIVGECKLTYTGEAWRKMRMFYLPIVAMALQRRAVGFVVVRNLTPEVDVRRVCATFRETLNRCVNGGEPTWHYLGKGTAL